MENKEKAWQRRGLFALVSNRRSRPAPSGDEAVFPPEEDEDLPPDEEERR